MFVDPIFLRILIFTLQYVVENALLMHMTCYGRFVIYCHVNVMFLSSLQRHDYKYISNDFKYEVSCNIFQIVKLKPNLIFNTTPFLLMHYVSK